MHFGCLFILLSLSFTLSLPSLSDRTTVKQLESSRYKTGPFSPIEDACILTLCNELEPHHIWLAMAGVMSRSPPSLRARYFYKLESIDKGSNCTGQKNTPWTRQEDSAILGLLNKSISTSRSSLLAALSVRLDRSQNALIHRLSVLRRRVKDLSERGKSNADKLRNYRLAVAAVTAKQSIQDKAKSESGEEAAVDEANYALLYNLVMNEMETT